MWIEVTFLNDAKGTVNMNHIVTVGIGPNGGANLQYANFDSSMIVKESPEMIMGRVRAQQAFC